MLDITHYTELTLYGMPAMTSWRARRPFQEVAALLTSRYRTAISKELSALCNHLKSLTLDQVCYYQAYALQNQTELTDQEQAISCIQDI